MPARRMTAWLAGFAARHGPALLQARDRATDPVVVLARDGAVASLDLPGWLAAAAAGELGPDPARLGERLAAAARTGRYGVLLVRRAGYAVAVVADGEVALVKAGHRYVQGRTAAGGWSQQRYARRRANQADALVDAVAGVAARILGSPRELDFLATGGDRPLVESVVRRLGGGLASLPRGPHLAIGNPSRELLDQVPDLVGRVWITLTDPPA